MMSAISYWVWFGTIYLLILTYQDYKDKMLVDDRANYFMYGVTIMILSQVARPFWYVLLLLGLALTFRYVMKKVKSAGEADINTLMWVFYGFGVINISYYVLFAAMFVGAAFLAAFLKFKLFKYNLPTPFYAIITIIFVVANIILGLY